MTFPSYTFALFFLAVLVFMRLGPSFGFKKVGLLAASYIFYGAWNPAFVLLLLFSTLVDYVIASRLQRAAETSRRRMWLGLSVAVNLGVLGVFKYGGFFAQNADALLSTSVASTWAAPLLTLTLPVGISFYTFQTLSYTIDIYRRVLTPAKSFWDYALYVSFFPQLVAGPIVRARDFLPQLDRETQVDAEAVATGLSLLVVGLFQKVVIADSILSPIVEQVYGGATVSGQADAWIGTLAFSGQILCDFAGYSLCAIGVAHTLGFQLPDNFRAPYVAVGFSDFWRRWHISLSSWLRDYLYIPLGGSRHGLAVTAMALTATMLLGGLWHGASWTFVAWGAIHGALLVAERLARRPLAGLDASVRRMLRPIAAAFTFVAVTLAWVPFRAATWGDARNMYAAMWTGDDGVLAGWQVNVVLATMCAIIGYHRWMRDVTLRDRILSMSWWVRGAVLGAMLWAVAVTPGTNRAFLYFQF